MLSLVSAVFVLVFRYFNVDFIFTVYVGLYFFVQLTVLVVQYSQTDKNDFNHLFFLISQHKNC